jgi:hypothetical protein
MVSKLKFFTVIILLSICAALFSSALVNSPIQEVKAQPYYDFYIPYYYPYSAYSSSGKYSVTVSVSGVPSEYSTTVKIDGNPEGAVPGGSSKKFEVRSSDSHVIQVEDYVTGPSGIRYYCKDSSWTLEKTSRSYYPYYPYYPYFPASYYYLNYTTPVSYFYYYPSIYYYPYYYPDSYSKPRVEVAHTFSYAPEYMLTVENPYGQSVDKTGWRQQDSTVSLSTAERVETSSTERNIFKAWNIDGSEMATNAPTLTMNAPHKAVAVYQTQYYLDLKSEFNQPQGSGWYNKGSEATASISPQAEMPGFWGALGGGYICDSWTGPARTYPSTPIIKVTMDQPMTLTAVWRQDYSTAYLILAMIMVLILVVIALAVIAAKRFLPKIRNEKVPTAMETLNLRYSKGEITREDYLKMKKDMEKS